ncbi:MAG: hypothetical protein HOP10_12715 [Chitinophagaceae bacterium]|nr:hypothetical protein [Chitinophagaceae bacterium]
MNEFIISLKNALGDCKRLDTSNCISGTSYEIITHRLFCVFDDRSEDQPVRVVKKREDHQLKVSNRNKEENEICVLKTDKCLFTQDHKKCDCILFNKYKCFFVEISETSNGRRNSKRNDAVEQLGYTINLLREYNIDLNGLETKAIICFKMGAIRPTQPSLNTKRALFLEQYKVSLEEGNHISFDNLESTAFD